MSYFLAALFVSIAMLLLALTGNATGTWETACALGGFLFLLLAAYAVGMGIWEKRRQSLTELTWFIDSLAKLDENRFQALGILRPEVRVRVRGRMVRTCFEDTNVPMEMVTEFLRDSNEYYISPQRNWYTKERPEWAWIEIYKWLVAHRMVIPDSAAGNTSHHWIGESYKRMMADYWMAGRTPVDLSGTGEQVYSGEPEEEEGQGSGFTGRQQVYAYDTGPLPHRVKSSGKG